MSNSKTLTLAAILGPLAFSPTPPAQAASFDCTAASQSDEKAICDNRDLNDLDVKMATQFDWLSGMFAMGARGDLQDQQSVWLKKRQACASDTACIKGAYEERLKQFDDFYKNLQKPAPAQ